MNKETNTSKNLFKILASSSPRSAPREVKSKNTNWIPWFQTNRFPLELYDAYTRSSTHRSAVNLTQNLSKGNGFIIHNNDGSEYTGNTEFENYLNNVNGEDESLYSVFTKLSLDNIIFGNFAFEVYEEKFLYHTRVNNLRWQKDGEGFIYSEHWGSIRNKTDLKKYPHETFEAYDKNGMWFTSSYTPNHSYYGLPQYYSLGGMMWIMLEYKIPSYNLSRIDNKFMPSGILSLFGAPPEDDTPQEYVQNFMDRMTGEGNNSKTIAQLLESPEQAPKYTQLADEPDGIFTELHEMGQIEIAKAHQINPALLMQTPGKLSNTSEIIAAYEFFFNNVVKQNQNQVLNSLNQFLENNGFPYHLSVDQVKPYRLDIDPMTVMTINEQRKEIGLPEIENGDVISEQNNRISPN